MSLLGPFSVGYPVDFRAGGDTTSRAFGQHIEEIMRIYGILTALDNEIRAADEFDSAVGNIDDKLDAHIISTTPHPNWKPNLKFSDLTGDIPAANVKGELTQATIDGSKVLNTLTQAKINKDNVIGLAQYVEGLINSGTSSEPSSQGITESLVRETGYVKFGDTLMVQWGKSNGLKLGESISNGTISFPKTFKACYFSLTNINIPSVAGNYKPTVNIGAATTTGITFSCTAPSLPQSGLGSEISWSISYIAIGS